MKRLIFLSLALFGGLAISSPAQAAECEHDCTEAVGCYGGCSVDTSGNCSAMCSGGACSYRCRTIGPECDWEVSGSCEFDPPPEFADVAGTGWALLDYSPTGLPDARVLAGSSNAFGDEARRLFEAMARPKQVPGESSSGRPNRPSALQARQTTLFYAPISSTCLPFQHALNVDADATLPPGSGMYFWAATGAGGRVEQVVVIHSRLPKANGKLEDVLRKHLHVWSPKSSLELEFVGFLSVDTAGGLSHGIAGVTERN